MHCEGSTRCSFTRSSFDGAGGSKPSYSGSAIAAIQVQSFDLVDSHVHDTVDAGGGAVHMEGGRGQVTGSIFSRAFGSKGGCARIERGAFLEIVGSTFSSCQALYDGGAIFVQEGSLRGRSRTPSSQKRQHCDSP